MCVWRSEVKWSHLVMSDSLRPHGLYQAPQSMEFSRQQYWSGSPFPSPGNLPYINLKFLIYPSPNIYAESKNKWTYSQNRNRVTDIENQNKQTNLWLPGVKGEGINWETGTDIHTQLYIKWKTNKDLLYSTGNSTQYSIMTYMGKQ